MRHALLALLLLLQAACAAAVDDTTPRFVDVQAEGWVYAVPDRLTLVVSARFTDRSMEQARRKADAVVEKVTALALAAGVEKEDIDSSRLSAFPEYRWQNGEREYLGETVERQVSITMTELDMYPALMGQLSKIDLHRVNPPTLSHSKAEQLHIDATRDALRRGREKASAIADEVGASLGPVLSVQEPQGNMPGPRPMMMKAEAAMADTGGDPGFNFGRQKITARLQVRFALQ